MVMRNREDLADLYRNRFDERFLPRKLEIWKVLCGDFFQRHVGAEDVVLDVACGYGEFINSIQAGKKIGVDLNPDTSAFLDGDVEHHAIPADTIDSLGESVVDVVFTSNFLEHLPTKEALERFLEKVYRVLKPGGRYLILGPNLRYLPGKYWDYYDHHLGLTHLSLSEALELRGFVISKCLGKFLPYTTQGALPTHPWLVRLYLRFPVVWRLLGKQFFVIATKPQKKAG